MAPGYPAVCLLGTSCPERAESAIAGRRRLAAIGMPLWQFVQLPTCMLLLLRLLLLCSLASHSGLAPRLRPTVGCRAPSLPVLLNSRRPLGMRVFTASLCMGSKPTGGNLMHGQGAFPVLGDTEPCLFIPAQPRIVTLAGMYALLKGRGARTGGCGYAGCTVRREHHTHEGTARA